MKIEQNENELIINESPGCLWILGLLFVLVGGVFVYGSLGGLVDYGKQETWMLFLTFVMGAIGVLVGIWVIYGAPITKMVINRNEETILITRFGLSGKQQITYQFDEIEQFCLLESKDSEGDTIWSLGLQLANGEMVKVSSFPTVFEEQERKYTFQANEFIRKQIPPAQMILELEDEPDAEMR